MKKFVSLALGTVMAFGVAASVASCGGSSEKAEPVAALITLHGSNSTYDKNFIDAFKAACKNKGLTSKQYTVVSDVPEGDACYNQAADLADSGYKAIFADSFGHEQYMMKAAKEYTNVQFCHATGTQAHTANLSNFHNAFASIYEGRYLAGIAAGMKLKEMEEAGKLTKANYDENKNIKIGYIGAFQYAEVISGYTSFYLGVKSVVENVSMEVQFTKSWYDETAEKTTANTLIQRGAALISQHADSMGAPSACETAGVPNVSYNGSTAKDCPNTFIVSSRINWTPYFEYMLDGVLKEGAKIDTDKCGSISDGSVVLTEVGSAAAKGTQEAIDAAKAKLLDGSLNVFDTTKFTVGGKVLDTYLADVDDDGTFVGETEVVENGVFVESKYRSAPYFNLTIDGITLLNSGFTE